MSVEKDFLNKTSFAQELKSTTRQWELIHEDSVQIQKKLSKMWQRYQQNKIGSFLTMHLTENEYLECIKNS